MEEDIKQELIPDKEVDAYHELYLHGVSNVTVKRFYQDCKTGRMRMIRPLYLRAEDEVKPQDIFNEMIENARLGYYSNITYSYQTSTLKLSYLSLDGKELTRHNETYRLYQVDRGSISHAFDCLNESNYQTEKHYLQQRLETLADPVVHLIDDLLDAHHNAQKQREEHVEGIIEERRKQQQLERFEKGTYEDGEYEEFLVYAKEKKKEELDEQFASLGVKYPAVVGIIGTVCCLVSHLLHIDWFIPIILFSLLGSVPMAQFYIRNKKEKELDEYMKKIELDHENREELTVAQEILSLMKEQNPTSSKEEEKNPLVIIRDTLKFLQNNHYEGDDIDRQKLYNLAVECMRQKTGERQGTPQMSLYDVKTELNLTLNNILTNLEMQQDSNTDQLYFDEITRLTASPSLEVGKELVKDKTN